MAEFQNTIDLLGDDVVVTSLLDRLITEIKDNVVTKIGKNTFYLCENLVSVNFPNVTDILDEAFSNCYKLANVELPNVVNAGFKTFNTCPALNNVSLPKLKTVPESFLTGCSLDVVDLGSATNIKGSAFSSNSKFATLILRSNTMCSLSNTSAFTLTPFSANGKCGTVYVPQALITEYQNATNWSTLYAGGTCNFVAIEGSEYE